MNNKPAHEKDKKIITPSQPSEEETIDIVDEASMESFPASDPPNYTQRKPQHDEEKKK